MRDGETRIRGATHAAAVERAHNAQQERKKSLMKQHRACLFDADTDGDLRLSFEEFIGALPAHLRLRRSLSELHSWFGLIDADGDGHVSLDEFVRWSMSAAAVVTGAGVIQGFQRYDVDQSGRVSQREFELMAEECGYGEHADELFQTLPTTDGTLDYRGLIDGHLEMMKKTKADGEETTNVMKDLLVAMAWTGPDEPLSARELQRSGWVMAADDPDGLRGELRKLLRWHTLKLSELFSMLDSDQSGAVSLPEFERVLVGTLGFEGARDVLVDAFATVDNDGDGQVQLRELDAWMRGRGTLECDDTGLLKTIHRGVRLDPTDADEMWDAERLRRELCSQLMAIDLTVDDLVEAWDREDDDGDGIITRREFLGHVKRLVAAGEMLWYAKVRGAASDVFDRYDANSDHELAVNDLSRGVPQSGLRLESVAHQCAMGWQVVSLARHGMSHAPPAAHAAKRGSRS